MHSDRHPKRKRQGRARLSDVAARAGVSTITVSRALRKPEMVSTQLRERVEAAARELMYVPNELASALASQRTGTIGVVVPSLTNGVFDDYLKALHDVFLEAGLQVLVLNSRYDEDEEERAIRTLLGRHPEAMIVAGIDQTEQARSLLAHSGIPVVQTLDTNDSPIDINIGLDHREAGHAATSYLLGLGHRRIGLIIARLDHRARRRWDGYQRAMDEAGIDTSKLVVSSPHSTSVTLGAELFSQLMSQEPLPDAVFCGNDDLALGTLFECHRRGIAVPQDISIVGFNDLEFCAVSSPSLTTISTPRYALARRAANIVLEIIRVSGERPAETRIDVGFELVERGSTGPRQPRP